MYTIKIPRADIIAKISFAIFIFITFFGTSLPSFQAKMQEIGTEDIETSNIVNQIIYPILFFLSFIAFLSNTQSAISIIKKEKLFSILLFYALITISWSDFPLVSFKRWFQIFTYFFVILVFLSYSKNYNELLKILKPILYAFIFISFVVVLVIPGAKDPAFGTWRGLSPHKNSFGQRSLIATVLSSIILINENNRIKKIIGLIMVSIAITLVIGSVSSTAYTALFIFLSMSLLFYLKNRIFNSIGAGYFLFFTTIFFAASLLIVVFVFFPEVLDMFQGIFGKEGSYDDRNRLWQVIIFNISQHPIQGCGFQGFWVIESPTIQLIYNSFLWLPIQGHNGYLDMINEIGLIGLSLFLLVIVNYFRKAIINKNLNLWAWFLVLPLVINITETTLFRVGHITNAFIIMGYLIMFSKIFEKSTLKNF
ncbi:MAG: O-antigen ligase family protein [Ignavibacteriales bacterium]|nr:O-antigen ligase family protein [Ignavibacteriales bacterium]